MAWGIKVPKINVGKALENATGIGPGRRIDLGGDISRGAQALVRNPGEAIFAGTEHLANQILGEMKPKRKDTAIPGYDQTAGEVLTAQQQGYQDYMKNLPSFQKKMAEGLAQQSMGQLTGQQRGIEQRNVSRGLGYGALNESMKEQARAQAQQQLASSIQEGNLGLLGLGEQMQAGIVTTGAGMQADLQNRMNQIYQRQQAAINAQNQQAGSLMGTAMNVGMLMALA